MICDKLKFKALYPLQDAEWNKKMIMNMNRCSWLQLPLAVDANISFLITFDNQNAKTPLAYSEQ